jgi:DNA polymerase
MKSLSFFDNSMNICQKCALLVLSRNLIVQGFGDPHAKLMFVGMAPGRNGADITGVPFTKDPSGVLFQDCLIHTGFSLESNPRCEHPQLKGVYVTNLVKCNPKDAKGNNRTPSIEEIQNCSSHFEKELFDVNPKVVVLLGKVVTEYVLKKKISKFGEIHNAPVSINNRIFLPFIHPSYVIRGAYNREQYIREMAGIKKYIE